MTKRHQADRHRARSISCSLIAAAVCAALVAQLVLPSLHALAIDTIAVGTAPDWTRSSDDASVVARAEPTTPGHDRAACPVCQGLTRANPVASLCAWRAESPDESAPALAALPVHARSAEAHGGPPPRAPPAGPVQLV